jgi:hypothetical protein
MRFYLRTRRLPRYFSMSEVYGNWRKREVGSIGLKRRDDKTQN